MQFKTYILKKGKYTYKSRVGVVTVREGGEIVCPEEVSNGSALKGRVELKSEVEAKAKAEADAKAKAKAEADAKAKAKAEADAKAKPTTNPKK